MTAAADDLADSLRAYASWHARRAFELVQATERELILDQCVSLGTSVELLLKFLLASRSPHLIAGLDIRDNRDALRARIALEAGTTLQAVRDIKSCSILEAFDMVSVLYPRTLDTSRKDVETLARIRNAAIHLAVPHSSDERRRAVVLMLYTFGVRARGHQPYPFQWPFDGYPLLDNSVSNFITFDESIQREMAHTKIRECADHFKAQNTAWLTAATARASGRIETDRRRLIDEDTGRYYNGFRTAGHKCVACKAIAVVTYEEVGEVFENPADPDNPHDVRLGSYASPMTFVCETCGLVLSSNELHALSSEGDPWARHVLTELVFDPWLSAGG